jgi:hypothetical protein
MTGMLGRHREIGRAVLDGPRRRKLVPTTDGVNLGNDGLFTPMETGLPAP